MFIRWIVRGHRNAEVADVTFHDAYLVESYRNENGEPRQNTVGYLGNIRQIGDEFPIIERELFLIRARVIMESMPELAPETIASALSQLQDKVSPLTAEEVRIGFENSLLWYYQWWQANGDQPTESEILELLDRISKQAASFNKGFILPED
jgi:uncharacterized DUF497 family protein